MLGARRIFPPNLHTCQTKCYIFVSQVHTYWTDYLELICIFIIFPGIHLHTVPPTCACAVHSRGLHLVVVGWRPDVFLVLFFHLSLALFFHLSVECRSVLFELVSWAMFPLLFTYLLLSLSQQVNIPPSLHCVTYHCILSLIKLQDVFGDTFHLAMFFTQWLTLSLSPPDSKWRIQIWVWTITTFVCSLSVLRCVTFSAFLRGAVAACYHNFQLLRYPGTPALPRICSRLNYFSKITVFRRQSIDLLGALCAATVSETQPLVRKMVLAAAYKACAAAVADSFSFLDGNRKGCWKYKTWVTRLRIRHSCPAQDFLLL